MATVAEHKNAYEQRKGELSEFLKTHTNDEGKLDLSVAELKTFNDRNDELSPLHDTYMEALKVEAAVKDMQRVRRAPLFGDPNGQYDTPEMAQAFKTMGELFLESDEYKTHSNSKPSLGMWKVQLEQASVDTNIKAAITTATGTVPYPAARPGIVPFATRRPVMRELVPMDSPGGQLVQFVRQNAQALNAAIVAQGAAKPQSDFTTERVVLTLEAIAHYMTVTDQALRFIPGLQNKLDQQGTLGIMLAEEDVMLNYNGSAGWKGFLQQTGVQSSALGSQDQFSAFHQGMNLVQYTGFANVTGGVIHNNDWHKVITTKDANGRFIYGDPFSVTQQARIWGVPLIVTPVITEGTVLIGDFVMDSRWWVEGGIIVKVGYINDDLKLNQQSIVVEEYGALEIDRPASFVKLTGWEAIS